jgi:hypothetical protein
MIQYEQILMYTLMTTLVIAIISVVLTGLIVLRQWVKEFIKINKDETNRTR